MNLFQQLYKSIYSPKDISAFRFQGIGKTIRYVFLLTLISILPTTVQFITFASSSLQSVKEALKTELPSFSIEDGSLSSEINQPMTVEKDDMTIIFDSTGEIEESDLDIDGNTVAFLEKHLVVINDGNKQSNAYSAFSDFSVTDEMVINVIDSILSLKWILLPAALLILYLFTSGLMFLKVTIFAMIGVFIAKLIKRNINFSRSWRIAAYSATVSTLFFTLMNLLQTSIAAAPMLDWFVLTVIMYLAIKEIPQPKKKA
ncbi:DUF1189 domain-containing protein [Bacillus haikouensis]|jgi:hypothetical protein|uniref:DUF1189 domain-containing protein n=1 Tax=Bacillus haikouensis TaxID=1510468 RepID=UPI0015546129|nr:DUF1189 domain-containing protein [Bacillus haikouensis]NQD67036.1 DUF1189 domain-containing protein [Bacillus haikouensis]